MSYDPNAPYWQPPPFGQLQNAPAPQSRQKSSLRWLWITLGIVGGLLILVCAACGIAAYFGISSIIPGVVQTLGSQVTAQQYYQAISQQDYATAYTYLTSEASITVHGQNIPLTQETLFATVAKALDGSAGIVSRYTTSISGSGTSHVTVTVTRRSQSYDVQLLLVKVNNAWKIQGADGI